MFVLIFIGYSESTYLYSWITTETFCFWKTIFNLFPTTICNLLATNLIIEQTGAAY